MQCSVDKSIVVKRCPDGGQSRLILLSLILHPVSQASHAPNHQKSWFWLMTKVIQQNTDQKRWLKWVSHHKSCKQLIFTNNQISMIGVRKKWEEYRAKWKKIMGDKQRLIRGEDHRGLKGLKFEPISQWWAAQMLRPLPKFGSPLMRTPMRANKARRSSWRSKSAHRATSMPSSLLMWSNISRSPKIFYIEISLKL